MEVKFFTLDKKYNSTKRPTSSTGTAFECLLKSSSSVISPTIELNLGLVTDPSAWNYAYISDYGRYYWVSEWTFINSSWIASLNVDVLASWRTQIGASTLYIRRCSKLSNGAILDMKYPMTGDITYHIDSTKGTASAVDYTFADGYYVVGVYGANSGAGSITYYAFTPSNYASFINQLYTNVLSNDNIWNELLEGIRNSIFDISSYIKSCRWYIGSWTLDSNLYPDVNSITMGTISINCTAKFLGTGGTLPAPIPQMPLTVALTRHPQATRGIYCNMKPYTRYKLVALPYGTFELDSIYMANRDYLHFNGNVDFVSGIAVLTVSVGNDILETNSDIVVLTATCEYGVNIPISATTTPNIAKGTLQATMGSGSIGVGLMAGAIETMATMLSPSLDNITTNSSGLALFNYHDNGLYTTFYTIAGEDNAGNGRPYFALKKVSTAGGYIEAESNDFHCPATESELIDIRRFIENGFYYE